jgi:23S rRNA pseudouridine1911/1915/1917 synthase
MTDQGVLANVKTWIVPAGEDIRLDAFARRCLPHLSRREIDGAIRKGMFSVNAEPSKKGRRLYGGDVLVFHGPQNWLAANPLPDEGVNVPILYEDDAILVLDKPAGMATHGFSGRDLSTLANFLTAKRPGLIGVGRSRWQPGLVHRLDSDTSGLVLVAKNQVAFDHLARQFRLRQVHKSYLALVWGETAARGEIKLPLAHEVRDKRRMTAVTAGMRGKKTWQATTRYERLSTVNRLSFLEIEMETGVTHQIRVHLATIGHPIVADTLYGRADADMVGLKRHFLHASKLDFAHPANGRPVQLKSDLPMELREVLKDLGLI